MTLAERLGDAVRRTYRNANLTQEQLAKAIGVSQSTVSEWVNGRSSPSAIQIVEIDQICGHPAGYIMRQAGLLDSRETDLANDLRVFVGEGGTKPVSVDFHDVRSLYEAILGRIGDRAPKDETPQEYALRAAWSAATAAISIGRTVDDEFTTDVADWAWFVTNRR